MDLQNNFLPHSNAQNCHAHTFEKSFYFFFVLLFVLYCLKKSHFHQLSNGNFFCFKPLLEMVIYRKQELLQIGNAKIDLYDYLFPLHIYTELNCVGAIDNINNIKGNFHTWQVWRWCR